MPNAPETAIAVESVRHENFESWYANSVSFFPSEWDLRMVFGEIDWRPNAAPVVQQHTAMTVGWLQAKLMQYFLNVHVGVYELAHGRISIPPELLGDFSRASAPRRDGERSPVRRQRTPGRASPARHRRGPSWSQ